MIRIPAMIAATLLATPYAHALNGVIGLEAHPDQKKSTAIERPKEPSPVLRTVTVARDLDHPWSLAFLPGGAMLITERAGHLNYVTADRKRVLRVSGLPKDILIGGQAGLFEIAASPDHATDKTVYFTYASKVKDGTVLKVGRAVLDTSTVQIRLVQPAVIFETSPPVKDNKNLGGKLLFMDDGTLLVSVGDFFDQKAAQHLSGDLGKVIRINADGTVPADNPFAQEKGARPEIYTLGNRNIQGMAQRPGTKDIWLHEHGPKGGDEVNILEKGANYGWPLASYGVDYSGLTVTSKTTVPGTVDPLLHWTPSIAPSGLAFYTGEQVPQWKGDAFVGALRGEHLRRLDIENGKVVAEEVLLGQLKQRIRDVRMGPDGYLYVLTDAGNGQLLRIEPIGESVR